MNKISQIMDKTHDSHHPPRLQARLRAFGATQPKWLCTTDRARLWRVTLQDGSPGVLKLYHGRDMDDERPGVDLMRSAGGTAMVEVLDLCNDAYLMRFLDGAPLGDMSRDGRDAEACFQLIDAVKQVHQAVPDHVPGLMPLEQLFQSLFTLRYGPDCPRALKDAMTRATHMAHALFATSKIRRPLHGDVHHDNAIATSEGVVLIDAKGLLGDPGFEMANTFCNPEGAEELFHSPDRALRLAEQIHQELGITPRVQLSWAAAKTALSISWTCETTLDSVHAQGAFLSMLLSLSDA